MRRTKFAVTVVAAGLWVVGGSAFAQNEQTSGDKRRQDTRSSDQTGREHRRGEDQANKSQTSSGTLSKSDRDFLTKAAENGLAEVQLGKLAQEKGSSEAVKELGQKLVEDHTKANEDLQKLAESKGLTLPTETDSKHKSLIDRLSRLSDGEFDREFEKHIARDHKKDIAEFRKESDKAADPDVKSFAARWLPGLEQHESQAEQAMSGSSGKTNPRTDENMPEKKKGKRQPDYNK